MPKPDFKRSAADTAQPAPPFPGVEEWLDQMDKAGSAQVRVNYADLRTKFRDGVYEYLMFGAAHARAEGGDILNSNKQPASSIRLYADHLSSLLEEIGVGLPAKKIEHALRDLFKASKARPFRVWIKKTDSYYTGLAATRHLGKIAGLDEKTRLTHHTDLEKLAKLIFASPQSEPAANYGKIEGKIHFSHGSVKELYDAEAKAHSERQAHYRELTKLFPNAQHGIVLLLIARGAQEPVRKETISFSATAAAMSRRGRHTVSTLAAQLRLVAHGKANNNLRELRVNALSEILDLEFGRIGLGLELLEASGYVSRAKAAAFKTSAAVQATPSGTQPKRQPVPKREPRSYQKW